MHFAKVIAGHDKNHIYFILKEDEKYVYLVNGNNKKICNPRRKNKMHIQIIKNIPIEIEDIFHKEMKTSDETIMNMLTAYQKIAENKV